MCKLTAKEILSLSEEQLKKLKPDDGNDEIKASRFYIQALEVAIKNTGKSLDEIIEEIVNSNDISIREHKVYYTKAYQYLKGKN